MGADGTRDPGPAVTQRVAGSSRRRLVRSRSRRTRARSRRPPRPPRPPATAAFSSRGRRPLPSAVPFAVAAVSGGICPAAPTASEARGAIVRKRYSAAPDGRRTPRRRTRRADQAAGSTSSERHDQAIPWRHAELAGSSVRRVATGAASAAPPAGAGSPGPPVGPPTETDHAVGHAAAAWRLLISAHIPTACRRRSRPGRRCRRLAPRGALPRTREPTPTSRPRPSTTTSTGGADVGNELSVTCGEDALDQFGGCTRCQTQLCVIGLVQRVGNLRYRVAQPADLLARCGGEPLRIGPQRRDDGIREGLEQDGRVVPVGSDTESRQNERAALRLPVRRRSRPVR